MTSSVRTLQTLRGLLSKAMGLIDAEIAKCEGKHDSCPHTDYEEMTTMRGPRRALCSKCGVQFNFEDEDHEELPETMGSKRRR